MVLRRWLAHPAPGVAAPRGGVRIRAAAVSWAAGVVAAARHARPSALRFGLPEQLVRVEVERAGDDDELGHVEIARPGLVAEDEAGRAPETLSKLSLGQTP